VQTFLPPTVCKHVPSLSPFAAAAAAAADDDIVLCVDHWRLTAKMMMMMMTSTRSRQSQVCVEWHCDVHLHLAVRTRCQLDRRPTLPLLTVKLQRLSSKLHTLSTASTFRVNRCQKKDTVTNFRTKKFFFHNKYYTKFLSDMLLWRSFFK